MNSISLYPKSKLSEFEEAVKLINTKFSDKIISLVFENDRFKSFPLETMTYYIHCNDLGLTDFITLNDDKTISIILAKVGIKTTNCLTILYDESQLVFKFMNNIRHDCNYTYGLKFEE